MSDHLLDCLIIGAGPAGLTAATYLTRFHRRVALVSAGPSRAHYIPVSHNCPGFPFGVSGTQLLARMTEQGNHYGVSVVDARIQRVQQRENGFVAYSDNQSWSAQTVLLATGIVDRLPPIADVEKGIANAVIRICAVCDGYEASDHRIAVYGPASSVIQHASFLRTYSRHVTAILSEPGQLTPAHLDLASLLSIPVLPSPTTVELVGTSDNMTVCKVTWQDHTETFDSFYPVLGEEAKAGLATALGARVDDDGELVVSDHLETSVDGLYAVGDVVSALNQISVAVGHAAIAATAIHHRLPLNAL
jgi:thioredoxin reductase (NADPH)